MNDQSVITVAHHKIANLFILSTRQVNADVISTALPLRTDISSVQFLKMGHKFPSGSVHLHLYL